MFYCNFNSSFVYVSKIIIYDLTVQRKRLIETAKFFFLSLHKNWHAINPERPKIEHCIFCLCAFLIENVYISILRHWYREHQIIPRLIDNRSTLNSFIYLFGYRMLPFIVHLVVHISNTCDYQWERLHREVIWWRMLSHFCTRRGYFSVNQILDNWLLGIYHFSYPVDAFGLLERLMFSIYWEKV